MPIWATSIFLSGDVVFRHSTDWGVSRYQLAFVSMLCLSLWAFPLHISTMTPDDGRTGVARGDELGVTSGNSGLTPCGSEGVFERTRRLKKQKTFATLPY